jgi:hypothetical protein
LLGLSLELEWASPSLNGQRRRYLIWNVDRCKNKMHRGKCLQTKKGQRLPYYGHHLRLQMIYKCPNLKDQHMQTIPTGHATFRHHYSMRLQNRTSTHQSRTEQTGQRYSIQKYTPTCPGCLMEPESQDHFLQCCAPLELNGTSNFYPPCANNSKNSTQQKICKKK